METLPKFRPNRRPGQWIFKEGLENDFHSEQRARLLLLVNSGGPEFGKLWNGLSLMLISGCIVGVGLHAISLMICLWGWTHTCHGN